MSTMLSGPKQSCPQEPLQARISAQAARTPQAIAFQHRDHTLRYAELDQAANRVAHWLLAAGIGRNDLVAVFTERDLHWPVAILGVLKAGAAYVPLDSQYPDERLQFILADCGAQAVLSHTALLPRLGTHHAATLALNGNALASMPATEPAAASEPDDLSWALYTSGSTGKPKGALLHRAAIGSFYHWFAQHFGITAATRTLLMTSPGFDLTQRMTLMPLTVGATVVLAPTEHYDAGALLDTIEREKIDVLSCTPSGLYGLLDDASERTWQQLQSLRLVVPGGEIIQGTRLKAWATQPLCTAEVHNSYGPTETHDLITTYRLQAADFERAQVRTLGKPLANVELRVLDEAMQAVPAGEVGTLYVAGLHVGRGYLNLPDKTAATFVPDPLNPSARLYKVGDLVRCNPAGELEFVGRSDHQVKVRGWRIELPEIEGALLAHPGVREAVVAAPADDSGERRLVAYVQCRAGHTLDATQLRTHLAQTLPDYMLPGSYLFMDSFPINANGKVDRTHLPLPAQQRPTLTTAYSAPEGTLEKQLAELWQALLGFPGIGRDDRFFELGGSSLMATQFVGRVSHLLHERIAVARFFAAPTLARFAEYLQQHHTAAVAAWIGHVPTALHPATPAPTERQKNMPNPAPAAIAIVGLACRLPDADTPDAFWKNLCAGREALRTLSDDELLAAGVAPELLGNPDYVKRGGVIADAYAFDAAYFGYTPREAELMDPQHRVLLECAHHALEHAGLATGEAARIGVFTGVAHNYYFSRNLASHAALRGGDGFATVIGGDKDFTATRIAYKLDLTGPAVGVQAACATSGIALHLACQAIRNGDCDAAIVGGARINTPQAGYHYVDGAPESRDGHIRAFAADASGMVLASGAACLVVKRLDQALADGDCVYAVVKGTAINNDGADKIAYTAPSEAGQAAVIEAALQAAGVPAASISYVEAHGTGTLLGDPIEIAALTRGYQGAGTGSIAIGSVKTNVGHLDAGAAAISLVKTALALKNKAIPATLHCETPNPECGFERTPFAVNNRLREWPSADAPRRAGVSSFGFGGTNFHGILEQAPEQTSTPPRRQDQLLRLSAKTDAALKSLAERLAEHLDAQPGLSLADVAYTLDRGRSRHPRRLSICAATLADASSRLRGELAMSTAAARSSLVFTFPGQGAQHVGMGRALYEREPVFRAAVDACAAHLEAPLGLDLRSVLYPTAVAAEAAAETLKSTQLAQPAIFTISYATAKLWESWGLVPDAMLGHSVGEFVAATLAGVFELEHALLILAERARLMQSMPGGGMLAVRLPEAELLKLLPADVSIAALNAPQLTVVSGPDSTLGALAAQLQAQGIGNSLLHTSHAFHSAMMEPAVAPFAAVVAQYPRHAPRRAIVSSLTGEWVDAETLQDPNYWAQQLRQPVRFAPALNTLMAQAGRVLLEVGPGQNLTTSARQQMQSAQQAAAVASLPHAGQASSDAQTHLLDALGKLWCAGIEVNPARFYAGEKRLKTGLPGMPFARTRFYIAPANVEPAVASAAPAAATAASTETTTAPQAESRESQTLNHLVKLMVQMTGLDFSPDNHSKTFLELGLDSLMLTQVASKLKAEFKLDMKFRQLMEDFTSINSLAAHLTAHAQGTPGMTATAAKAVAESNRSDTVITLPADGDGKPKTFGAGARISKVKGEHLSEQQETALAALTERYVAKTGKSKAYAQQYRDVLADPRTVSGFRPILKELIYPIVTPKSEGAYLWDLDGHQYVDVTCGFGSMFFGHRAPFVIDAVEHQMRHMGYEIGPQSPLAGECARLIAEFTGLPRVAFCATGSEAVLAAMRTARTVTGKNLIVMFNGDYHGMFDEVIFRGTASLRTLPAAPGIPPESVANTLILDFGSAKALEIIEQRADEIAAVIVEPVQSRRCDFQPREFLLQLRELTTRINAAYVFDEIVTGFRASLGGAQGYYGIQADMGSYGKVIGGGMSIGIIAGTPKYMDALDGGSWQFGDDSVPEVGVTYFAGTFVRHPLSLAACKAVCQFLKANPGIYADVNARTARMVETINLDFQKANAPLHIACFTSLWKPEFTTDQPFGDLLYMYLREAGIHIWDGRPCFLSIAHSDADAEAIIEAFRYAVAEMQKGGFFTGDYQPTQIYFEGLASPYHPPLPGARIGRDADGNPAWFVPDPASSGKFVSLELR